MSIGDWVKQISTFNSMSVVNQMLAIGYYLHTVRKLDKFVVGNINLAFDDLHLPRPSNPTSQLKGLTTGKNKRLLHDAKGYRLTSVTRDQIVKLLPPQVVQKQLVVELKKLEAQVTDPHQKTFLEETITCFSHGAYRAAIVMAWNLAYHHACAYILAGHLVDFNKQLALAHQKKKPISQHTDFEDLKESDVIAVAKGAQIFSVSTSKVMTEKLTKRNTAAHPSSLTIMPVTAEEVISDLVQNIILRPTL
jgi:hypothetical protein